MLLRKSEDWVYLWQNTEPTFLVSEKGYVCVALPFTTPQSVFGFLSDIMQRVESSVGLLPSPLDKRFYELTYSTLDDRVRSSDLGNLVIYGNPQKMPAPEYARGPEWPFMVMTTIVHLRWCGWSGCKLLLSDIYRSGLMASWWDILQGGPTVREFSIDMPFFYEFLCLTQCEGTRASKQERSI